MSIARMGARGARKVSVKMGADVSNFSKGMGVASGAAEELINKFFKLEERMVKLATVSGRVLQGVGAMGQGMMTWATMTAASWEDAFALVEKTTDAPKETMTQLNRDLRQLTLEIPVNNQTIAQLGSLAGQLGVTTSAIDDYVDVAAKLGVATDMEASQAIFQLTQFANIVGTAEDQVENLASSLVHLGNNTASTESRIMNFSLRVAGVGNVVGLAEADIMGLSAAMASAGVAAERGGTATSRVLLSIQEAAQLGGSQLNTFAQVLGMTTKEFQDMQKDDPTEVLIRFVESLRDAGDEAALILNRLSLNDQRLVQSFLSLAQSSQDLRTTIELSNYAFEENNALQEEAEKRFSTLTNSVTMFRNSLTEVRVGLGQYVVPLVTKLVDAVRGAVNVFNALPESIKGTIGLLAGLGSAVALVAGTLLTMTGAVVALGKVFLTFKFVQWILGLQAVSNLLTTVKAKFIAMRASVEALENAGNLRGLARGLARLTKDAALYNLRAGIEAIQKGLAAAAGAAGKFAIALLKNPVVLAAGALAAAGYALYRAYQNAGDEAERLAGTGERLAKSMGMQLNAVNGVSDAFNNMAQGIDDSAEAFAVTNSDMLNRLRETSDEAARNKIVAHYALELNGRGATAEEIEEVLQKINALLPESRRITVAFDVDDPNTLKEAAEASASILEEAGSNPSDVLAPLKVGEGWWEGLFGQKWMKQVETAAEANALLLDSFLDAAKGPEEQAKALQTMLIQISELERQAGDSSAGRRAFQRFTREYRDFVLELSGGDVDIGTPRIGFDRDFEGQEITREIVENLISEGARPRMIAMLRDMDYSVGPGSTEQEIAEAMMDAINRGLEDGKWILPKVDRQAIEDTKSDLDRALGPIWESLQEEDSQVQRAFLSHSLNNLPAQIGLEATAAAIDDHIEKLGGLEQAWKDPDNHIFIQQIQQINEELAQTEIEQLEIRVNNKQPMDALRSIRDRINELKAQGADPIIINAIERWTREEFFRERIHAPMAQLHQQETQARETRDRSIEQANESHARSIERAEENHQRQVSRARENHQRSLQRAQEDHQRRERDLAEQHQERLDDIEERRKERLEDIKKAEEKALKDHAENLAGALKITERVQSQRTENLAGIALNTRAQNAIIEEWAATLKQLEEMGMSTEVMEEIGLTDPTNWQQAQMVLRDAMADPSLIGEVNREWEKRLKVMEGVTKGAAGNEIRKQFQEQREALAEEIEKARKDAIEQYNKQMSRMGEEYQRRVKDMEDNHSRSMKDMDDNHARSLKDMGDNHARRLEDINKQFRESMKRIADNLTGSTEKSFEELLDYFANHSNAEVREFGRQAEQVAKDLGLVVDETTGEMVNRFGWWAEESETMIEQVKKALDFSEVFEKFNEKIDSAGTKLGEFFKFGKDGADDLTSHWSDVFGLDNTSSGGGSRSSGTPGDLNHPNRSSPSSAPQTATPPSTGGTFTAPRAPAPAPTEPHKFPEPEVAPPREEKRSGGGSGGTATPFATGGIATQPIQALIAEAGHPESVIPLNHQGAQFMADVLRRYATPSSGGGLRSSTEQKIIQETNFNGPITVQSKDPDEMAYKLKQKDRFKKLTKPPTRITS